MAGLDRVRTAIYDARASSRSGMGGAMAMRLMGRVVLWVCVAVVLIRGIATIVGGRTPSTTRSTLGAHPVATSWPDDEARAFAVRFARVYLTLSPGGERTQARVLARLMAPGLSDQATVMAPSHGPGTKVAEATVAREVDLGGSRALLTVAVFRADGPTRYLSVPVARDANGGLVVADAPSFTAPPPRAVVQVAEPTPLSGAEAPAISDLVSRFLTAYVEGQPSTALAYLTAPGSRVAPMSGGLELRSVDQLETGPPAAGDGRTVLAAVHVHDASARAVFAQRYRLRVVRSGTRWLVSAVAGGPSA